MLNQTIPRALGRNPSKLVRERNPARNLQMKKNGLGRKSHPKRGDLNPSRCQILTRFTIGEKITRHGYFIIQNPAL
jgi:hypothetical protein